MAEEDYAKVRMHQRLDFKAVIKCFNKQIHIALKEKLSYRRLQEARATNLGICWWKLKKIFLGGWDNGSARHKNLHLSHKIHVNMGDMAALICNASIGLTLQMLLSQQEIASNMLAGQSGLPGELQASSYS